MLRNGTTTALVFGTVHAHSADAIFEAAGDLVDGFFFGNDIVDAYRFAGLEPHAHLRDPELRYTTGGRGVASFGLELVAAGFTPEQALLAATREAARVLDSDTLGVLQPGSVADFLVLSANFGNERL